MERSRKKREQELLTEIELLKNPPLTSTNKEKVKATTIVKKVIKEVVKEVVIKNLENKELGFKLSSAEKAKLEKLSSPQEIQDYQAQLIKDKFNQLKNETKQLTSKEHMLKRERERESNFVGFDWFVSGYCPPGSYEKD